MKDQDLLKILIKINFKIDENLKKMKNCYVKFNKYNENCYSSSI